MDARAVSAYTYIYIYIYRQPFLFIHPNLLCRADPKVMRVTPGTFCPRIMLECVESVDKV